MAASPRRCWRRCGDRIPPNLDCDLALDSRLDETGLDSLARMDALNQLEEAFGLRFSEDALYDMATCRDVIEYVEANTSGGSAHGKPAAPAPVPSPPAAPRSEGIPAEHYDVTQFPECVALGDRLAGMAAAGLENPFFRVKDRVGKATVTIAGREVVSYTSFDYLGMARDPQVIAAAKQATDRLGTSASASRLVGGNHAILQQLDEEIARFLGTEAAIVFPSGYGTNASVLGHLFGEEDLILYDELAHNSIVQGTLLSKAQRRPFPHNDFEFLDKLLRRRPRRLSPRRRGHRGRLQHGRRLPGLAAVRRSQAAAQGAALCRRGALAGRHGRHGAGHLRTFRRRSGRRRPVDGHDQQGPGKLRRIPRRPRDTHAVPEIHHARFCLRHRAFSRQRRGRLGSPPAASDRTGARGAAARSARDCF